MCDSLVALGSETRDGVTIFAKNSDRRDGECQPFVQFPAMSHPTGARVRATHVEIPQVSETYRVMGHSPWWVWGFEQGVNEHRLAIGNQTVFSREAVSEEPGLIGMDLVRLGLERGRTAREALEIIATLVESHGQGGAAMAPAAAGYHNSFALADPEEAWLFETSGRHWVARRARLDALSNHLCLGADWEIGSRDVDAFARSAGWWTGNGRVNWAGAYRNPGIPGRISEGRQQRSRALLEQHRGRIDVTTLGRILRDHLDGGPVRAPGATPDDEHYFTLCMHSEPVGTTTASLIAPLPTERNEPWPVWVSFATPCIGVFLPVYLDGVIPETLARGGRESDEDSVWWALKRLQDAAAPDFPRWTPVIRSAWTDFEGKLEAEREAVEAGATTAAERGDADGAARLLGDFMERSARETLARAHDLRQQIARS